MAHVKKYFVTAHTARGFVTCLQSNLQGIQHIYVIKAKPNVLTAVFTQLINRISDQEIEVITNIDDPTNFDGIIIREKSLAIFRKQSLKEPLQNANVITISKESVAEDESLVREKQAIYEQAYHHFRNGLSLHEQLEKIYIAALDVTKANELAASLIAEIFADIPQSNLANTYVYERFFATNTPDGIVNFLEMNVNRVRKRYFLKGRAGTGKSSLIRNILAECQKRHLPVEKYRCSLDPDSIDMIIIGHNECCIFDATPPHELAPSRKDDVVIDLYREVVQPGTDEKYQREIANLQQAYKAEMQLGLQKLVAIKTLLKPFAYEITDLAEIDQITNEIYEQIVVKNK